MNNLDNLISLKVKNAPQICGLIHQGECCTIELLQWAINNSVDSNSYSIEVILEVSVARLLSSHLGDLNQAIPNPDLRRFAFSCTTIDAVIFLRTDNLYPLLAIERQGIYHNEIHQQENDLRKLQLVRMINLPLLWQDEPRKGILRFLEPPSRLLCKVNPFSNEGRDEFRQLIWTMVESRVQSLNLSQVA